MAENGRTVEEQQLLDMFRQLDERDRHKLMLAARSLVAVAEDNRRRGL